MDVRVLGPIEVIVDGLGATPTSPNQRTVLAVLAARPDQQVRIDTLIDAIWGADPPPTAEKTLRSYISRLRGVLGDAIEATGGGFRLGTNGIRLDARAFADLVSGARLLSPEAAADGLRAAVSMWRGDAFGELADLDAVCAVARSLEQLKVVAREQLADALLRGGEYGAAVAEAEALLAEQPFDEAAWETLIRALSASGRTADALGAYRRAHDALADIGLEPSARLRAAQNDAFTAPAPVARSASRAPAPTAEPLLGRDTDLATLADVVERERLTTIVGPGGVGKTALARELVRQRGIAHSGGVRIVELAAVADASAVPDAVVTALGLTSDGSPALSVLRRARLMDVVVLLDNCEHVLDAACEVLDAVLGPEPAALRVVATSRELVGMPGECAWPLEPLDCTDGDSAAQRFFRRRAAAARPGSLTDTDDDAVTGIVRRLDGLPLAIELAAAQIATLGVTDLAEQLDGLSRRGGEPRHRTLRAAIEWSERLLSADARTALSQWPVFAGAVGAADAVAVLDTSREVLNELARSSLLNVEIRSGRTYYRMLQTVRSVAGAPTTVTERRHLDHFAEAAAQAAQALETPDEPDAHRRLTEILDELRSAHGYARRVDPAVAVELSMSLHRFGVSRLQTEVLGWAAKLSPLVQDRPDLRAAVDSTLAYRAVIAEQLETAQQRAHTALADASEDATRCRAMEALGDSLLFLGELEEGLRWWSELAEVGARSGEIYYEVLGHVGGAMSLAYGGRKDAARRRLADLETRFAGAALSHSHRSWLAYLSGEVLLDDDPDTALAAFTRAIELADSAQSHYVGGVARVSAITLQSRHSPPATSLPMFAEVIDRYVDAGSWSHLLTTLRNLVPTLAGVGADVTAARILGAVTRPDQTPTYGEEAERLAAAEAVLVGRLGDGEAAALRAAGGTMDVASAGRLAVSAIRESLQPVEPEEVVVDR